MPLQLPNLDNRTFEQLLQEAKRRIPVYTPEWTNYDGDSDPGITIVQVFAFLTESLLYRANRIPDRDRLKFLQLLGIGLQPAAAAQGMIVIQPGRGATAPLPLNRGVVVTAGAVGFLTLDGVNVLPVQANLYYKSGIASTDSRYSDLQTKYNAILTALNAAGDSSAVASSTLSFYETAPMQQPVPGNPNPILDLKQDTIDRAVYIALCAPVGVPFTASADQSALRSLIAGNTLSIGIAAVSAVPPLLPVTPTSPSPTSGLIFEIADAGNNPNQPSYARLQMVQQPNVLTAPGVVQVTLPQAANLQTWDFSQPLTEGTLDYPPKLDDTTVSSRLITWLRVRLPSDDEVSGGVASVPEAQLTWVDVNASRVQQTIQVNNEALGTGSGDPDQTMNAANVPVIPSSVLLISQNTDGSSQIWRQTDDLLSAGSNDGVYTIDPESGLFTFGTGLNGARPAPTARFLVSYLYGGGAVGNVGIGAIKATPDTRLQGGYTIANPIPTWAGADTETQAEGEQSIPLYLRTRDRLVTKQDFIDITNRTPGVTIGRIEVLTLFNPDDLTTTYPGVVTVMVVPQNDSTQPYWPVPDWQFLSTICSYLDPRRLVTTEIYVRGPVYVPVYLSVGVQIMDGYFHDTVIQAVTQGLSYYLSSLPPGGNAGTGWPLSKSLLDKDLEAFVTRVPGVEYVNDLFLQVGTDNTAFSGLQLPQLAALSVIEGSPVPLANLISNPPRTTGTGNSVPVPISTVQC